MLKFTKAALALLPLVANCEAAFERLPSPVQVNTFFNGQTGIQKDGGLYLSTDDTKIFVTSGDGSLTIVDSNSFTSDFVITSSAVSAPTSASGVAVFETTAFYAIYEASTDKSYVASFDQDGTENWVSSPLGGTFSGDPVVSFDGAWVYINMKNKEGTDYTSGTFYMLDNNANGTIFFQEDSPTGPQPITNTADAGTPTTGFSPLGIFHNPSEGFYKGGEGNTRDVMFWACSNSNEESKTQYGATYVFQLPIDWKKADGNDSLSIVFLKSVGWQTESPPGIGNSGTSIAFTVSRNQQRVWVLGDASTDTSEGQSRRPPNNPTAKQDFWESPNPPFLAGQTAPVITEGGFILSGQATNDPALAIYSLDLEKSSEITTNSPKNVPITAQPLVSSDDLFVFWVDREPGTVYCTEIVTGENYWNVTTGNPISGDIALSADNGKLYFGDEVGNVYYWKIAVTDTMAPTVTPSPTNSPSATPTTASPTTTDMPTDTASVSPTATPTAAPTSAPTAAPTTATPTAAPTSAPTVKTVTSPPTAAPTSGGIAPSASAIVTACAAVGIALFLN